MRLTCGWSQVSTVGSLPFPARFAVGLFPFCISLAPCDICLSSNWLLRLLQLYKSSLYTTRMRRKTEAAAYDCKLYEHRVTRFFRDYILTEFFRFFLVVTNFAEICTMGKFWALSASSKFFSRSAARIFELEKLLENMVDHEDKQRVIKEFSVLIGIYMLRPMNERVLDRWNLRKLSAKISHHSSGLYWLLACLASHQLGPSNVYEFFGKLPPLWWKIFCFVNV